MGKITNWFKKNKRSLSYDDLDLSNYYTHHVNPSLTTTTTGTGVRTGQLTAADNTLSNARLTGAYQSVTSSGAGPYATGDVWDRWTKEEKKTLANVGFQYDRATKSWKLKLSVDILVPQEEAFSLLVQGSQGKPTDQMIARLKQAKEALIEKLTAKIILAELTKPREIKE